MGLSGQTGRFLCFTLDQLPAPVAVDQWIEQLPYTQDVMCAATQEEENNSRGIFTVQAVLYHIFDSLAKLQTQHCNMCVFYLLIILQNHRNESF